MSIKKIKKCHKRGKFLNHNTHDIIFCDIEANTKTKKVEEIGLLYKGRELKTFSPKECIAFIELCKSKYIAGHNFIDFDMEILRDTSVFKHIKDYDIIDTLPLSLLFFNEKTVHSLPKNYKSEDDFRNNPLEDSKITMKLFRKLEERFLSLNHDIQTIFYSLLKDKMHFKAFFKYIKAQVVLKYLNHVQLKDLIFDVHKNTIVDYDYLQKIIKTNPVELSYILALLTPHIEIKSHPPKVLYSYPNIVEIQKKLCFDLHYANEELNNFSKEIFGFGNFRQFPRLNAGVLDDPNISQREIVEASLRDESFLAVLPTGGGKTFTFWLPAIFKAKSYKGLTVVISPLQALIEDHIKSFNVKVANFKAVAISGFMSPLERSEAIEQVINGEADILYLAPESLRSNLIFGILKNRFIERFVVDEAHCLSTWGNDFRQDYYYICEYIKELLDSKPFQTHIPISCFTATAKPSVIKDIEKFFQEGLAIKLEKHLAVPERKNLTYTSIPVNTKDKYDQLLKLINENKGSTLVYIPTSTKKCDEIAENLSLDTGKYVKSFHGKLESQVKMEILKDFIENRIDIIVATTAFGMGVDKSNIMNVIHYEVSDSLESYAQEAGRGARDEKLNAYCPILFSVDDLDKHFNTLSRSKVTSSEINSIFRVIKNAKRDSIYKTAFELAKEAGWDVEDSASDYATKVKTALLELEREGYISRRRNKTSFFADSIATEAMAKLHKHLEKKDYSEQDKQTLILVLQTILGRGKIESVQVDELAYLLGYDKDIIALAIHQLKDMNILGDSKDLSLELSLKSINKFKNIEVIETLLFKYLSSLKTTQVSMRELNEYLFSENIIHNNQIELIKSIIKTWRDKSYFLFKRVNREQDLWYFQFLDIDHTSKTIIHKHQIAKSLLAYFSKDLPQNKKENIVFSLKELYEQFGKKVTMKEIDKTLLYLHHLYVLELLNGRFISYIPMDIHVKEKSTIKRKYTEYKNRMQVHYQTKIESIHIMGEYAKRLIKDDYKAILFLKDYFTLSYDKFKRKYHLLKKQISRPITQQRFNKIFENMSEAQQEIIQDTTSKAMMVLAGPGSGKTKVLVHKIASLILTEDTKPEQFMMLTFSKTAKWEFKTRLNNLIGSLSYDVEIQTFHSYALKLIARNTKNDNSILDKAIEEATNAINQGELKLPYLKVLVLDEFQDINEKSFELIKAVYQASNKELRIIAVGDDDQCIMEHIGADVRFIDTFKKEFGTNEEGEIMFRQYELLCNFRSHRKIVEYSNDFIFTVSHRYKHNLLYSNSSHDGVVMIYSYPPNSNLVVPTIMLVKQEETLQNIAVLAFTNDEVMQIYSLLQENNIEAKYIIERKKFKLKNIIELFDFNKVLNSFLASDETSYKEHYFEQALEAVKEKYKNSSNLKLLEKIVDRFMNESDDCYISQWISYLEEIKLEDFEDYRKTVVISTIHKSKGMEFDKVFLLVSNNPKSDASKRLYYVGMTRAKYELAILRAGKEIKQKKDFVTYIEDKTFYQQNNKIFTHVMNLSDISLGFDVDKFSKNDSFYAGCKVTLEKRSKFSNLCIIYNGRVIATLSTAFNAILKEKLTAGYHFDNVVIDNVVVWFDKINNKYIKHPLCKVVLTRIQKN